MPNVKSEYETTQIGDIVMSACRDELTFWKVINKTRCYITVQKCIQEEYKPDVYVKKGWLKMKIRTYQIKEPASDSETKRFHISKCDKLLKHYINIYSSICVNKIEGDKMEINDIIQNYIEC